MLSLLRLRISDLNDFKEDDYKFNQEVISLIPVPLSRLLVFSAPFLFPSILDLGPY